MVKRERALIAGAVTLAVIVPALLTWPPATSPVEGMRAIPPISLAPVPATSMRALFDGSEEAPIHGPALAGIVGRLPDDAVALVRTGDGRTRSLRRGEMVEGWTLVALSADAAAFTRGGERLRVALAGE